MQILKVYGPYTRKQDDRKIVVLRLADGNLTTKSYARFLYEQKNGEIGDINLTVDHIDEDVTNDILENFDLLTRADNIRKSAKQAEMYSGVCPICNTEFQKPMRAVRGNWKKGKAGPFCSRQCAGFRNKEIQLDKQSESP
jgi:endogenous inhibitor of DNA gyrase (YacG/DUF329 family)